MDKKESFIYKQVIKFNQSNDFLEAVKKRNIEACKKVLLLKPNAIVSKTIDKDIVMDKLLEKPSIGMDILLNIFNTMKANNTLHTLQGTKIGKFFELYMRKNNM